MLETIIFSGENLKRKEKIFHSERQKKTEGRQISILPNPL